MASTALTTAPYGAWKSRITADLLVQKTVGLSQTLSNYHGVPDIPDSVAPVASPDALSDTVPTSDLTGGAFNVRSGVHEYGGGASTILSDGSVLFTDFGKWGVYRVPTTSHTPPQPEFAAKPERVDPPHEGDVWRFANFAPHPTQPHLVACIREDHTDDTPATVVNDLVLLDVKKRTLTVLARGADFYSNPTFSPSGTKLAYTRWSHPRMPFWDTELVVVSFDPVTRSVGSSERLVKKQPCSADGEVLQQPKWQPTHSTEAGGVETLFFTSDRTQFANIYSVHVTLGDGGVHVSDPRLALKEVLEADAQQPAWELGGSNYVFLSPGVLFVVLTKGASDWFALYDLEKQTLLRIESPFRGADSVVALSPSRIAAVFSSDAAPTELATLNLATAVSALKAGRHVYALDPEDIVTIKRTSNVVANGEVPASWFSRATETAFPTTLPNGTKSEACACLFPPHNPEYKAPEDTLPPCRIVIHGGPTGSWHAGLKLEVAYWTSRGWMVAALNYGGSTGFGRAYIDRLNGQWGVVDVEDCASLARFLGRSADETLAARAQADLLRITDAPDGSVTASLDKFDRTWGVKDFVAGLALGGLGASLVALSPLTPALAAAVTVSVTGGYLFSKALGVQRESVQAIPGVGLQLTTVRGLRLPWSDHSGCFFATGTSRHLIPRSEVQDLVVHESIQTYQIMTDVAVVPHEGKELIHLFPATKPRIPLVRKIYTALLVGLFPHESVKLTPPSSAALNAYGKDVTRADPKRIVVSGGSSGGYTVLASLVAHPTAFNAGTSRYGISELSALFRDSHKFENCYPEVLLGGTPDSAPETYKERSPLYGASKIRAPLLVLQGGVDRVVPPAQSEDIVHQIQQQSGGADRVKYVLFPEEGHGFRQAANQKRSLEEEAAWYAAKLSIEHQF